MEIGEAAGLADQFSLSLIFKVHSLPISERSPWARRWRDTLGTRLGVRQALDEQRRQLKAFAAVRRTDRTRDRQMFITLSALVDDDGLGRCPALSNAQCGIYARRPLTCRTVPLHYSRALSTLAAYLDDFTSTPGYQCDTTTSSPLLSDQQILSEPLRAWREQAVRLATDDRGWKAALADIMAAPETARAAGLPTLDDVIANSDRGYASCVPMLAAWRVAENRGLMTQSAFDEVCRGQIAVLQRLGLGERIGVYRDAISQSATAPLIHHPFVR